MMDGVTLKKDGFYYCSWNGDKRIWETEKIPDDLSWILAWAEDFEVDAGVTLGDIFAILALLDDPSRKLFEQLAEVYNLDAFIEEAGKPAVEKSDIDYIEIRRYVELSWYKREGLPSFENHVGTSGRCENDPHAYALDFTPVNQLLHCEIRLSPDMRFDDNRGDYNEKGEFSRPPHELPFDKTPADPDFDPNAYPTVNGKVCECTQCDGEKFTTSYTLGEFMRALFDDIAFHGDPATRDERMGELIQTRDDYFAGKLETVPLEDVLDPDSKKPGKND